VLASIIVTGGELLMEFYQLKMFDHYFAKLLLPLCVRVFNFRIKTFKMVADLQRLIVVLKSSVSDLQPGS